jgi:hypothetical protein
VSDRRLLATTISAAVAGVLLSAFFHSNLTVTNFYSDIGSLYTRGWVASGQVPYSSSAAFLEYPPVSGLVLYTSRIVGGSIAGAIGGLYSGYYWTFSALSLAAAAVLGWSTWRLANALGTRLNPVYFLLPSMVVYGIYNFDLFNALFIVLSLQLFVEKKRDWSAATLGVALATKFVAGVMLPIFILELGSGRERIRYLVLSLVAAGVFFVPILLANAGYFSQFLSFYSSWGLEDAWYIWIFQDPFSHAAKSFGLVLLALLLLRVYTLKMPLVQKCFLALSAYLLSTYIYAPQFNVMLVPLFAVMAVTSPYLYLTEIFNSLIILTWFTVGDPTHAGTLPQAMALLRSATLAFLSLSVGSAGGHSFVQWLRMKAGFRRPDESPSGITVSAAQPVAK